MIDTLIVICAAVATAIINLINPEPRFEPDGRVLVEDLLAYKAHEEAERHRGLDELVAEGQKLGMY